MKIEQVSLKNFRCFEQLDVTFHPQLTVLTAPNGAGKTTILDAVRIALWPFVKGFDLGSQTGKSATIQIEDVRLERREQEMEPILPCQITVQATGIPIREKQPHLYEWQQVREQVKPRTQSKGDRSTQVLTRLAKNYQSVIYKGQQAEADTIELPLIVYLGTGRLWYQGRYTSEAEDKKLDASVFSRLWGYQNCLTATSSYKQFESWYGWVFRSYRELQIGQLENQIKPQDQSSLAYFAAAIEVVQRAINTLTSSLTGWHDLQYRASMGQQLVMEHYQHGYMPLAMLSDGLRNMVATVSDIAFRCIKLNPHLKDEAAQKTAGIVLIDEVDMFLHPAWQQQVLGALQEAFPLLQFIVTTHSPQVLTTVAKENIRQLGSDEHGTYARMPPFSPLAHENSDALAKVMETHSQPSLPLQETISEYELLVRSGEETSERATTLLATLEQAGYQFHESDLATWRFLARRKLAAKGS
ncbi:AAA family ATPase [Escherichia coli]|uniref:AAA family ATPase n=1 Tax=Escherichia coli TaxID=562 RepID=UPI0006D220A5|nr:AAA family ATPase [Escherichia coli]ELZ5574038.1 AAA family ATPase [Escherichia coli]KPO10737.1 ATP-binding protein [Escherichia coli]KPO17568.1 ATP-binding protein [Escherichia coli]MBL9232051.1 AAA family ATPase [Escherichia coli]MDI0638857.1 AAA family ATPase [Escherichia coli]